MNSLIVFLMLAVGAMAANPYCSISTCTTNTNTLCLYSNTTWGSKCAPSYPSSSVVSSADITTILATSNQYRSNVALGKVAGQPAATNMRQLIWDNELATMAQAHAQQCVFQHDTCRDVSRFQVGQNIYISFSTAGPLSDSTANWKAAIDSWYSEVQYMTTSSWISSFPSSTPNVVGHYTQLVWGNTYTVGCGVASYKDTTWQGTYPYKIFMVCNYGPAGNFIGSPIYATSGSCPSGTTKNASTGLCA